MARIGAANGHDEQRKPAKSLVLEPVNVLGERLRRRALEQQRELFVARIFRIRTRRRRGGQRADFNKLKLRRGCVARADTKRCVQLPGKVRRADALQWHFAQSERDGKSRGCH